MTFHCLTVLHLIIYTVDRLGQGLQHQGRRIEDDRLTVVVVVVVVSTTPQLERKGEKERESFTAILSF
jgi:hypothetical protein